MVEPVYDALWLHYEKELRNIDLAIGAAIKTERIKQKKLDIRVKIREIEDDRQKMAYVISQIGFDSKIYTELDDILGAELEKLQLEYTPKIGTKKGKIKRGAYLQRNATEDIFYAFQDLKSVYQTIMDWASEIVDDWVREPEFS